MYANASVNFENDHDNCEITDNYRFIPCVLSRTCRKTFRSTEGF